MTRAALREWWAWYWPVAVPSGLVLLLVGILAIDAFVTCDNRVCVKSHEETRHMYGWTQFILSGKVMVPVYHPPYDYQASVCDQYADGGVP